MLTGTCIRDVFWSENVSALLFENFHLHFAEVLVKHVRCGDILSVFVLYIGCLFLHDLLLALCQEETLVTAVVISLNYRSWLFFLLTLNRSLTNIHTLEKFCLSFLGIRERLWCWRQHELWLFLHLLTLDEGFKSS